MATIEIPAEYVGGFKVAAAIMVAGDAERVKGEAETARKAAWLEAMGGAKPGAAEARREDLASTERGLAQATRILADAIGRASKAEGEGIKLVGDGGELAWMLGTMVEQVTMPQLTEALNGQTNR